MKALSLLCALSMVGCATGPQFTSILEPGAFAGWHTAPGGTWTWRGDVLVGTSPKSERRHGILLSDARYSDFEVQLEFRVLSGDSGCYFRVDEKGGTVAVNGFQSEVDTTLETGGLYETGGRAWVVKPDPQRMREVYQPGEWTSLRIRAVGRDVDVYVNGYRTASLRDDPGRTEGHLGLQLHGGQDMHVEFRNLQLLDLSTR
ncbi:MAG: DUF1080 domain-containing protein [Planctomycetota bacterium]